MHGRQFYPNPVPDSFYSGNEDPYSYLDGDHLREDYYAWTWGDALFVVIDPYWYTMTKPYTGNTGGGETSDTGSGDRWDWTLGLAQFDWLKETLESSDAKYKFIFAHHMVGGSDDYVRGGANPAHLVEWGGYNENGTTSGWDTRRPGWGSAPIHQILVANHVSAFFHGHDHQYAYEKRDDMVYQSLPSAGFSGNGFNIYSTGSGYTIQALPSPGHLRVTVGSDESTVDYVGTSSGTVNYTYTIEPEEIGPTHNLTLAVSPPGGGTTSPSLGTHAYAEDEVVNITANANPGYAFDSWTGEVADPDSASTTVTMDEDMTVTAHFVPTFTLTYTAGSGGSVSGISPQSVKSGEDGTQVTAVANAGYHFVRWSDNVLTASRTDTDVTANLSVSAEFAADALGVTVTQPSTVGPFGQGSSVSVAFTVSGAPATGMFHTYAYKGGTYYWLDSRAATGAVSYSFSWNVTQPVDSGYVIRTWYVDGSGNWLVSDDSSPTFAITTGTLPVPTVTAPSTSGPFSQGSSVSVAFNVAYAGTTGMFHTYAYKDGTYYWLDSRAATGAVSYSFSWNVTQPVDSGYVIRTWYVDGSGNWLVSDDSSPTFAITTGTLPVPTVTAPTTAGPFSQGSSVSVAFNVAYAGTTGYVPHLRLQRRHLLLAGQPGGHRGGLLQLQLDRDPTGGLRLRH